MGDTKCMQNVMLVSQNAQLNCLASVLIVFLEEAPILLELLISLGDNGRRYTGELVTGFFLRVFRI